MRGIGIFITFLVAAGAAFAATLVLRPGPEGKDSMVNAYTPNENWGPFIYLTINYGPTYEARGLIEFDLSEVTGATINAADLDLWIGYLSQTNYNFGVYRVTGAWQHLGVTWNNQPSHHATAYDAKKISGEVGGPYTWDVKKLVQEWASKTYPNYGLMVKRVDMNNPTPWPYFCSSNHINISYRPRLTVDYSPVGIAPKSVGKVKVLFR